MLIVVVCHTLFFDRMRDTPSTNQQTARNQKKHQQTPTKKQVAVIEYARSVLGLTDADSAEFNAATPHPAVVFMPEISTKHMVRAALERRACVCMGLF